MDCTNTREYGWHSELEIHKLEIEEIKEHARVLGCRRRLARGQDPNSLHGNAIKTIGIVLAATVVLVVVCLLFYSVFLNQGHLEIADITWVDNRPMSESPYVHLDGIAVNSGVSGARQVELVTSIYDSGGILLTTQVTGLGDIPSGTYRRIDIDIRYSGKAAKCGLTLRWKPFGG